MKLLRKIKTWLLKQELTANPFTIGGYGDQLIRIRGKRFLSEWEVEQVHKWRQQGRIVENGVHCYTSPVTGIEYCNMEYFYKPKPTHQEYEQEI